MSSKLELFGIKMIAGAVCQPFGQCAVYSCAVEHLYRRISISGTKQAQITFPLRHFFPLEVVPLIKVLLN
jgi:hypothetical protein